MASADGEKEWRALKLIAIVEDADGSNNYAEFQTKSRLKLDAAGYWKYVDGDQYSPPVIPELVESRTHTGLNTNGDEVTITTRGNEVAVNVAKKSAEAWLAQDKKALAIIVDAVPMSKLYLVEDCKSARQAWMALREAYEPTNALTAVTLKGQISSFMCGAGNPVVWRATITERYQRLRRADPNMMSDHEFAKCLVSNMCPGDKWQYCRDLLLDKMSTSEQTGMPLSSAFVIARLQQEESTKGIFATAGSSTRKTRNDVREDESRWRRCRKRAFCSAWF
ncbi:hypothetical protein R3P38DRAFT_2566011 [Favolaschia claudopus]|uniref:Uncharacterized protein n=1 Tax=Favolaschia claudopus TaxID=2862362 RepID=A0AAV9ZYM7_9AGAR